MRKFTLIVLLALFSQVLSAQIITDSIRTQAAYANDVYYSFKNGEVKSASSSEWQLAFRIGGGLSIRSNTVTATSGIGSVTVYEKPGKDTTQWASFDTTGMASWQMLDNTDTTWEAGAFNVNKQAGSLLDFSWGMYNMVNHHVIGNRLYLVSVKTGASSSVLKKLWVVKNALGIWTIKYANIDGSNEQVKVIKSADHAGYNFAYLSLLGDSVFNHEPVAASWDFVLTRYAALQPTVPPVYYPVTGILTNIGVKTAEVKGKNVGLVTLADTTRLSDNMSEIGSDWKQLNASFQFYTPDSLTYFVKAKDGAFWKLNFTKFAGSSTGNTVFTKMQIASTLAIDTNKLGYGYTGGTKTLQVTSNGNWTMSGPSWVKFSPAKGNGNATVNVWIDANPLTTLRNVTVNVIAGHLSKTISIEQEASLQAIITDTIRTSAAYANDVYYSLNNGNVKEITNSNWQVAFSIGALNVDVRSNSTTTSSGVGSVVIYQQGTDTNNWASFDTTGFSAWTPLDNSDTTWGFGAFNMNGSNPFNFGWGTYDMTTHTVTGTKLYLAAIKTGASTTAYKKIWIVSKNLGTWTVKYANLDGSNEVTKVIRSADFAGKNFAYLSLIDDEVYDREPVSTEWDFVLTRYGAMQATVPPVYYPVTGILTNNGVKTGEVRGKNINLSTIADTTKMSVNISEIGSDWKVFNLATFGYAAVDSLSYFVKAKDGGLWKVVFRGFSSAQGTVIFTKQRVPMLSVNTTALGYVAAGESKPVNVTANSSWTAETSEPSWVSLSAANGNGNASVGITVAANTELTVRTATVTFTSGNLIKVVNITQEAAALVLEVSNDTMVYLAGGETQNLGITSNSTWTITNVPAWITPQTTNGTGSSTVDLVASVNTTNAVRNADITVTSGSITRTIHLTQDFVTTGMEELKEIRIISAYPNPSNGTFTIENQLNNEASVEVFNLTGIKADSFKIGANAQKAMDYNTLPSGVYMLHILTEDAQQHMRLLISK